MKTALAMTVDELAIKLNESAMGMYLDPVTIGQATHSILAELYQNDCLAVEGVAAEVAETIAAENREQDSDMISVIRRQSAMHAVLTVWLAQWV